MALIPEFEDYENTGIAFWQNDGYLISMHESDPSDRICSLEKLKKCICWLAKTGVQHGSPEWDMKYAQMEGEWKYSLRTKLYVLTAGLAKIYDDSEINDQASEYFKLP